MDRYLPSWRGAAAVAVSLLALLFIPALAPAKRSSTGAFITPVSSQTWLICGVAMLLCLTAVVLAIRGRIPDRIAAVIGLILTLFSAWDFVYGGIHV
jgi:hypothetical protein